MKTRLSFVLAFLLTTTLYAQTPLHRWSKYIDTSPDGELIYDIKATADKGYIAVGYESGAYFDKTTAWYKGNDGNLALFKTDSLGALAWRFSAEDLGYGYTHSAAFLSVELTVDGGYLATGYGQVLYATMDALVVKFSSTGQKLWTKKLGGTGVDKALAARLTSDGGYIIAGQTTSTNGDITSNHGGTDAWLVKLDANGNKLWSRTYGGTGNDTAYAITTLPDGGFLVAGTSTSSNGDLTNNKGGTDGWLFKVDAAGILQWQKNLGGSQHDVVNRVTRNDDDTYILSGFSFSNDGDVSNNHGNADAWVAKTDNAGNILWSKLYGGSKDDATFDLRAATDQGLMAAGFTESEDGQVINEQSGMGDFWVIRLDQSGNLLWERSVGTGKNEFAYSILPVNNTDFVVAGMGNARVLIQPGYYYNAHFGLIVRLGYANSIRGTLFMDNNSNGVKDVGEHYFDHAFVTTVKAGDTSSAIPYNGLFTMPVDTGTYTTTVSVNNPYYIVIPASRQSAFSTYYNIDPISFAVQPIANNKDLMVHIVPWGNARPGFNTMYYLFFENVGTETITAGTVKLVKDPRTVFASAAITPDNIAGDTISWNFTNLAPFASSSFNVFLKLNAPPAVNFGDTLNIVGIIEPITGDVNQDNNTYKLRQLVRGAYDPNDKTESNAGVITPAQVSDGEYLNYLIRFQNTGTDTAFNVIVRDTLESRLDWSTLQMVTASHPYQLTIDDNNRLSWLFPNILLADSNINEPASHGYIAYRIRPKATVMMGDTIRNTAAIYFDFNPPVATNISATAVMSFMLLPAHLKAFKAELKGSAVQVSWQTATEYNSDYFEVQRSTNGKDFVTIGKVQAKNIAQGAQYAFIDASPAAGYNYYRLNAVDQNQASRLSSIVLVNVKNSQDLVAAVYPNPAGGEVTVDIKGDNAHDVSVSVIDQAGRVVLTRLIARQSGSRTTIPLSLGRLSKGLYTLRVTAGKHTSIHQLLVR